MRKKCRVCGASLDHDRCHYCGTDHAVSKHSLSQSESLSTDEISSTDSSNNDIPSFDIPTETVQADYSQPLPMMMAPKKRTGLAVMIGMISVLLIVGGVWLFSMTIGGPGSLDALELLERSHAAQAEIESMIMEISGDINVSMPGISMDIPMTMRMETESDERMRMDMSVAMMGMEMDTTWFLRDGYQYSEENVFGAVERDRSRIDPVDPMAMEMADIFDTGFLTETMIEDSSAIRAGDGYRLEYTFNMAGMISFIESMDIIDDVIGFDPVEFFEDWDVRMVMYLDENYLPISSELDLEANIILDDVNTTLTMTMTSTITQLGDVTINFPDWLDEMDTSVIPTPSPTPSDIEDSSLLGYWENGSGFVFLWVFGEADSVEFLVDGTLIITEGGNSETVNWIPEGPGSFIADGDHFTYSIRGDVLTITDSANDDWSFDRSGGATPVSNRDHVNTSNIDFVGDWVWEVDDDFIYIFNADGTGARGFSRSRVDFEWYATEDDILYLYIGSRTEEWEAVLEDEVLTLSNLNNDDVWSYIRND